MMQTKVDYKQLKNIPTTLAGHNIQDCYIDPIAKKIYMGQEMLEIATQSDFTYQLELLDSTLRDLIEAGDNEAYRQVGAEHTYASDEVARIDEELANLVLKDSSLARLIEANRLAIATINDTNFAHRIFVLELEYDDLRRTVDAWTNTIQHVIDIGERYDAMYRLVESLNIRVTDLEQGALRNIEYKFTTPDDVVHNTLKLNAQDEVITDQGRLLTDADVFDTAQLKDKSVTPEKLSQDLQDKIADVDHNAADISALEAEQVVQNNNISANTSSIESLDASQAVQNSLIADLQASQGTQDTKIATLESGTVPTTKVEFKDAAGIIQNYLELNDSDNRLNLKNGFNLHDVTGTWQNGIVCLPQDDYRWRSKDGLLFTFNDIPDGFAHNFIYRGKYMGTAITQEQYAAIADGTFRNLFLGDYWILNGRKYVIVAFDYYLNTGDTACLTHHIVLVPANSLYSTQYNESNITTGGYVGSKLYTSGLNQAAEILATDFGNHLLSHRVYLINSVDANGVPNGGLWESRTFDLMTERMVYGTNFFSPMPNGSLIPTRYEVEKTQLPLFMVNPSAITNRGYYWLRDSVSSAWFAYVHIYGYTSNAGASRSIGVRPAITIQGTLPSGGGSVPFNPW